MYHEQRRENKKNDILTIFWMHYSISLINFFLFLGCALSSQVTAL